MGRSSFVFRSVILLFSVFFCFSAFSVQAEQKTQKNGVSSGSSGLPLPRFVSLKSNRVNVRVGPGQGKYAIAWSYRMQGLPVEIIQEYDNWRRIRDSDGDTGWINQALLSGKRTIITAPWQKDKSQLQSMHRRPSHDARTVAQVESGVIGVVRQCNGEWCELEMDANRGWMKQDQLWGVYPGEQIK